MINKITTLTNTKSGDFYEYKMGYGGVSDWWSYLCND